MDRLLDKSLSATSFAPDADTRPLPTAARTVVIGGGIIGTSTAYHLAAAGDDDVLLLERNVLGSGTTWHAAGLCSSIRSTTTLTELASYGISEYRRLQADSGVDISFTPCGSVSVARTRGRMDELRYTAAIARQQNIPARILTPDEVVELWPLASREQLVGGLHQPEDGYVNPGYVPVAYAKLAHELGVVIRQHVEVLDILSANGHVVGVRTSLGDISCERVVLTAGLWTRDLANRAGASVPIYAAEHVHVRTAPIAGVDASLPVLRDMDGYLYVRAEEGCLLVGAFEPNGLPRRVEDIPTAGFAEFPPDWEHFAPVRAKAGERVPTLEDTSFERFLNAPESFTPDAQFCLGESGEVENLFVGAGFNSQGIIYGPGAGRALAEWVIAGAPTFDASAVDVRRFSRSQSNRRYLHERTREGLGRLYAMHWPHLEPETARGIRRSPLHERVTAAGGVFGEMTGWERANWYAPAGTRGEYSYSYQRQNWFETSAEEHRAAREAVAVFDLSSFAKIEVAGPDALDLLQRFCTANVDLVPGRVRYTLMLNGRGGIELDGTVVRWDTERFWVITPTFSQQKTFQLLKRHARGRAAAVFDATAGFATIAVMGPNSRDLLSRISPADWSDSAQPYTHAREVEIGDGYAQSIRVSFVGELGFELYPSADQAVNIYDALIGAGADLGLRPAGYHALDSLRAEKGYRHLGHDIGPADDPFQASLGFALSWEKEVPFLGRDAIEPLRLAKPTRRAVYVALDDPEPLLLHDETIKVDGEVVGRVTSGAYGHTLGRAVGIAFVRADVTTGESCTVDIAGEEFGIRISDQPFYDPENTRLRG